MGAELREKWACTGCYVTVRIPGKEIPAPKGWDVERDRCRACTAGEEKPSAKPQIGARMSKNQKRNADALKRIEAALRKDHRRSDEDIAEATRTAPRAVAETREKLHLPPSSAAIRPRSAAAVRQAEEPPRPKKRPKGSGRGRGRPPVAGKVKPALEADPSRSNREIAEEVGVSTSAVRKLRQKLRIAPPKLDSRGQRAA